MADRKGLTDFDDTPEDVATLYSWANLHGAKYRDFSASRAQTREKARIRVEEAIEAERRRVREESETQKSSEILRAAEAERPAEQAAMENNLRAEQQAAERAAEQKAIQKAEQESHQRAWQSAPQTYQAPTPLNATPSSPMRSSVASPNHTPARVPDWQSAAQQGADFRQPLPPSVSPARAATPSNGYSIPQTQFGVPSPYAVPGRPAGLSPFSAPPQPYAPAQTAFADPSTVRSSPLPEQQEYLAPPPPQSQPQPSNPEPGPMREERMPLQSRSSWEPAEPRETLPRPAWLSPERPAGAAQPQVPQAPEDTLQSSRDRLTSRWFALKTVFAGAGAPAEAAPAPVATRAPVLAVFSLAGGVGKTSLVATLGRTLSARGERVLLVDTAAYGLLPFFFGARDQRPGVLRTFTPPGVSGDAPIQTLTIDPETLGPENAPQELLTQEITRNGRGVSRIIVDLATASGATTRRVLRMAPAVLVPVVPDMSSVVSVGAIDAFFQRNTTGTGQQVMPYYVVNQFDSSLPLHLDVREVLREQLGDRLLPFAIRRTPALSEALAEGMTLVDYAPNSPAAEDFSGLAGWVKSLSPPAQTGYRGVRWSER